MWRELLRPAALALTIQVSVAGPFPPGPGAPGSDAIPAASPLFTAWATGVQSFAPGPRQSGGSGALVSYGSAASVAGPPDSAGAIYPPVSGNPVPAAPVLSLGDGGSVTLAFSPPVTDGEGPDFAVFENGFTTTSTTLFAELAFVEVSSNGADFVRFPAVSLTQTATQVLNSGALDPTNLHNLAGKYPAGYGTPFDLAELADEPRVDIRRITHIRLIDVTGDVLNGHGSRDSLDNLINDPWPTNFQTGGFDLDAVGVIHQVPAVPDLTLAATLEYVELKFVRETAATGGTLALEHSTDGDVWESVAVSTNGERLVPLLEGFTVSETPGGPYTPVTVTGPRTGPRRFFRLRITRTP